MTSGIDYVIKRLWIAALILGYPLALVLGWSPLIVAIVGVALVLVCRLLYQLASRAEMSARSFAVYQAQNPSCVIGEEVTCNQCSSSNVAAVTSKVHSDFREHACRECGALLYYSRKGVATPRRATGRPSPRSSSRTS